MNLARVAASALALILGGWLLYDGLRAISTGDYTKPSSGPHAHELGPWAALVRLVGLDPRGAFLKWLHVALGALWCLGSVALLLKYSASHAFLLVCAIGTIWYLPFGTVISLLEIALLVWLRKSGG